MEQWKRRASLVFRLLVILNFHHVHAGFIPDEVLDTINSSATFSCHGRILGDFYADVPQGCRVFHACVLNDAGATIDVPLACAPGTLFDQSSRQCQPQENVHCEEEEYANNANGLQEMVDANNVVQRRRRSNEDEEEVEEEREIEPSTVTPMEMKSTQMPKKTMDMVPKTHFTCRDKKMGAYYTDVETGCKLFHICALGVAGEVLDFRFLCLNKTQFNPETMSCDLAYKCQSNKKMMKEDEELTATTTMISETVEEMSTTRKSKPTTTTTTPIPEEEEDIEEELEEEEEITTLPPARKRTLVEDEINRRTRGRSSSKSSAQSSKRRPSRKELDDDEDQDGTVQHPIVVAPDFQVLSEGVRTKRQVVMMPASGAPGAPCYDYSNLPLTSFTCANKLPGHYYADPEAMCQMYHVCAPSNSIQSLIDFRFLCPNETVFNQASLKCTTFGSVDCVNSPLLYALAEPIVPAVLPDVALPPSEVLPSQSEVIAAEENVPPVVAVENAEVIAAVEDSDGSLGSVPEPVPVVPEPLPVVPEPIPVVPEPVPVVPEPVPVVPEPVPVVPEPVPVVPEPVPVVPEVPTLRETPEAVAIPEPVVVVNVQVDSDGDTSGDVVEKSTSAPQPAITKKPDQPATTNAAPKTTEAPTTSKPEIDDKPDSVPDVVVPVDGLDMIVPAVDMDMAVVPAESLDMISPVAGPDMVAPVAGPDMISSVAGADMLSPLAGPDMLSPVAGPDMISPVAGPDMVAPVAGPDMISSVAGADMLSPVAGPDVISPVAGPDMVASVADTDLVAPMAVPGPAMSNPTANLEMPIAASGPEMDAAEMIAPAIFPDVPPAVEMMNPESLSVNFALGVRNAVPPNIENTGLPPQITNNALSQPVVVDSISSGQESVISAAVAESEASVGQELPIPVAEGIAQAAAVDNFVSSALSPIGLAGSQQIIPPIPVPGFGPPPSLSVGQSADVPFTATGPTRMGPINNMMQSFMLPGMIPSNGGVVLQGNQYGAPLMPFPFFDLSVSIPPPAVPLQKKTTQPSSQSLVTPLFHPFLDQLIMGPSSLSGANGNAMFVDSPLAFGFPQQPMPLGSPQQSMPLGFPQQSMPLGSPQQSMPLGSPQQSMPLSFPQQSMPLGFPQQSMPLGFPQQSMPLGFPQQPMPFGFPQQPVPFGNIPTKKPPKKKPIIKKPVNKRPKPAFPFGQAYYPPLVEVDHFIPPMFYQSGLGGSPGIPGDITMPIQMQTFKPAIISNIPPIVPVPSATPIVSNTGPEVPVVTEGILQPVPAGSEFIELWIQQSPIYVHGWRVREKRAADKDFDDDERLELEEGEELEEQNAFQPAPLSLHHLPKTTFSCVGKVTGGYYADIETGCQLFHVCARGSQGEVYDFKFLCTNHTAFNQQSQTCAIEEKVDCASAPLFYPREPESVANVPVPNAELGRLKVPTASRLRNKRATVVDSDTDQDSFPETSFSCKGKKAGGYYADPETDCHVFHVCSRGEKGQVVDFRFRCANETVFNQRSNTCDEAKEVDCENSIFLYNSDDEFSALSRIPDTDDEDEDK